MVVAGVLVELPGGLGLIRSADARFEYRLTDDVSSGLGQPVGYQDRYAPEQIGLVDESSLIGGLLPPGAVSAQAVDDRGTWVVAAAGGGAYVAVLEQPNDGREPIVCCRDAAGRPVRRPWAADYPAFA